MIMVIGFVIGSVLVDWLVLHYSMDNDCSYNYKFYHNQEETQATPTATTTIIEVYDENNENDDNGNPSSLSQQPTNIDIKPSRRLFSQMPEEEFSNGWKNSH